MQARDTIDFKLFICILGPRLNSSKTQIPRFGKFLARADVQCKRDTQHQYVGVPIALFFSRSTK
uniref:Uncharacterized protein n=1 Tax=Setaria italica TaxID=4555 RepID=K3ZPC9_SETIT